MTFITAALLLAVTIMGDPVLEFLEVAITCIGVFGVCYLKNRKPSNA